MSLPSVEITMKTLREAWQTLLVVVSIMAAAMLINTKIKSITMLPERVDSLIAQHVKQNEIQREQLEYMRELVCIGVYRIGSAREDCVMNHSNAQPRIR